MPQQQTNEPRMTQRQLAIVNLLPDGDTNAMPTNTIAHILNTSKRIVRQEVNTLITVHSVPIGSKREGGAGYYLIQNSEQRDNALLSLYAQIRSENKRIHALETIDFVGFNAKKKAGAFTE